MKSLMIGIVVATLGAGSAVWAGTQVTYPAWGQYHRIGTDSSQVPGHVPMEGQTMQSAQMHGNWAYGRRPRSRWNGRMMSPRHRVGDNTSYWNGGHGCSGPRHCW